MLTFQPSILFARPRIFLWTVSSFLLLLAWDYSGLDLAMAQWFGSISGFALESHWLWRNVLHEFFNTSSKDDYSWSRPNRMFAAAGLFMPSMSSESMGPVDVVIDTSGSIGEEQLNEFAAEIRAIVAAARPKRVRVIYADAAVNHVDIFEHGEDPTFYA